MFDLTPISAKIWGGGTRRGENEPKGKTPNIYTIKM